MSSALVLGGGGPVGIGWQAGLLAGLAEAGVTLGGADLVIGTSAGSVVGAQLTIGRPLVDVVAPIGQAPPWASEDSRAEPLDIGELMARGGDPVPEEDFVARFEFLSEVDWPETFRCTAFNLETGQPVVWDRNSGVELHRAVASSCCVPGLTEMVIIDGARYIDGGARDSLNADLAIGHDIVVAFSCTSLEPPDGAMPDLLAGLVPGIRQRIDDLRASGSTVEVVEPSAEACELSGWGHYLMDHRRTADAFAAGARQATAEAGRLGGRW